MRDDYYLFTSNSSCVREEAVAVVEDDAFI